MKVIGIDVGGTAVKYGLLEENGKLLESGEFPTEAGKGIENLFENMRKVIDKYMSKDILGIAVSGTGQIDGSIGKIIGGNPIIPGWIGTKLVERLEKKYSLPAVLENDVNCAALGEKWLGAGRETNNFVCLTIGTGIGGGIVLNDEIFRGDTCVAGEFGHIQIEKDGEQCLCGKKGCYERYASATALVKMVREKTGKNLNGKEIFELEKSGDKEIKKILDKWIDYFTDGLSTIVYIFNPSLIVIGGGITKQGNYLLDRILNSLSTKVGENYRKNLKIKFAELGNNAGMLGAEYLLLKKIGKIK